jgi:hypothetical protein
MSVTAKCREQKVWLMAELGDRCKRCSATNNLEFDCIVPNGKAHHGKSLCDRIRFYVAEFHRNNLQLLCAECHSLKSVEDKFNMEHAFKRNMELSVTDPARNTLNRGPEPSVSDWAAWCRWHRGEPPI